MPHHTQPRPLIIAVVGPSGAGKTTAADFASRALGIPVICSYTTRPMRPGETEGVEHHFVSPSDMPPRSQMLAYTEFGGHHYWTTFDQVSPTLPNLYIVDERGLLDLLALSDRYRIISIYITSPSRTITDPARLQRDNSRTHLPRKTYTTILHNTSTLQYMLYHFTLLVELYKG